MGKKLDIAIEELIPHRPPMILIDELVEISETRAVCLLRIRENSLFLEPEGVPAYAGIEYMAQAIAAHGGYRSQQKDEPVKAGFLLGTPRLTSGIPYFRLDATLRIEVETDWTDGQLLRYLGGIFDHGSGERLQRAAISILQPKNLGEYLGEKHRPVPVKP